MSMRRHRLVFLLTALLALIAPISRAGALCARSLSTVGDDPQTVHASHEAPGHGDDGRGHGHGTGDAEHCATATTCVAVAAPAERATESPAPFVRELPAPRDDRPQSLARVAPEPPPPRA